MENDIKIKDLFIVLWEQKIKLCIISLSLLVVMFSGLMFGNYWTKSIYTSVELNWENASAFKYPDKSIFRVSDIASNEVLEEAKVNSNLSINVTRLYKDEILKLDLIVRDTKDTKEDNSWGPKVNISLNLRKAGLSIDQGYSFIEEILKSYRGFVLEKNIRTIDMLSEYDLINGVQEPFNAYEVLYTSVHYSAKDVSTILSSTPNYTYNNKRISTYDRDLTALKLRIMELKKLMVYEQGDNPGEGNLEILSHFTSVTKFATYVENLGDGIIKEIKLLEEEETRLKALISNGAEGNAQASVYERLVQINSSLINLEELLNFYNPLMRAVLGGELKDENGSKINYFRCALDNEVANPANKTKECKLVKPVAKNDNTDTDSRGEEFLMTANNLYYNSIELISIVEDIKVDFNKTDVSVIFLIPSELEVKSSIKLLFYPLVVIASGGIACVAIWIIEDWDNRNKKAKK